MILSAAAAIAALTLSIPDQPTQPVEDVQLFTDRVEFITETAEKTVRDVWYFDWTVADPEPTALDDCVASAQVLCGVHNVKRLKFTQNADGTVTCEFECKDGPPTLPGS